MAKMQNTTDLPSDEFAEIEKGYGALDTIIAEVKHDARGPRNDAAINAAGQALQMLRDKLVEVEARVQQVENRIEDTEEGT
jgi:hypothetical protein